MNKMTYELLICLTDIHIIQETDHLTSGGRGAAIFPQDKLGFLSFAQQVIF